MSLFPFSFIVLMEFTFYLLLFLGSSKNTVYEGTVRQVFGMTPTIPNNHFLSSDKITRVLYFLLSIIVIMSCHTTR
jgi:hypothetical protein